MDRKPQQQTLSIRISDSLREFLERSKQVISAGRQESVSTSDVAKILLESAKDDRLDFRLEVAELGQNPTEAMAAIRRKWLVGQPRSRAEWILMAQYIQVACEELTGDPLAPGPEPYVAMLEALLAVRGLRADRGAGLDRYYLGNLLDGGLWNERKMNESVVPEAIAKLIEEIRSTGSGKKAAGVGRCFYVAVRDEDFHEIVALNTALEPHMNALFRMAARGHWIRERRPVRRPSDGAPVFPPVPVLKQGTRYLAVSSPADIAFSMGFGDVAYTLTNYAEIREFGAMLKALEPEALWDGVDFHASAQMGSGAAGATYMLRRRVDGVTLCFTEQSWQELKSLFFAAVERPELRLILQEMSLIYGEL